MTTPLVWQPFPESFMRLSRDLERRAAQRAAEEERDVIHDERNVKAELSSAVARTFTRPKRRGGKR
ncbi:MAG TPA: hypothetical protein VFI40_04830 [Nocardioides sp.]|nr:hypothetical protein [Nocardioides sp.]